MSDIIDTASATEDLSRRPGVASRMLEHPGFMIGAALLVMMMLIALLAPMVAPHSPYDQDILARLYKPFWHGWADEGARVSSEHLLGTDKLGRDYLSRIIYGAQTSLAVGFSATLIAGFIGTTLGLVAGYFGGRVDFVINFIINVRLSLPFTLIALAVAVAFKPSLTLLIILLGLFLWDRFAVVVRGLAMQIRERGYVVAARALGASHPRIILTEILPNTVGSIIVVASVEMAIAILSEAGLSFLGLGVQPPTPSWGLMLAEAKLEIFTNPWLIAIPGLCLFVLLLAVNLLGDGLRDIVAGTETI